MKGRDEKDNIEGVAEDAGGGNSVFIDYDLYAHYLEDTELTEEQKQEFLQLLWNIVCEFVALGWGVHPLQQARDTKEDCGKRLESAPESAVAGGDAVQLLDTDFINQFAATGSEEEPEEKEVEDGQG